MLALACAAVAAGSLAGAASAAVPAPAPGPVLWADEFNAAGSPAFNPWEWTVRKGAHGPYSCATRRPKNVIQLWGVLAITARYEPDNTVCPTRDYTMAALSGTRLHGYGRYEARVHLPVAGSGIFPAFWAVGPDYGEWAATNWNAGEIDVMEFRGRLPDRASTVLHSLDSRGRHFYRRKDHYSGPFAGQWHTFAVDRRPGRIDWIIDGMIVWTQRPGAVPTGAWDFDHPFILRLNMQVGGWGGTPTPADFPRQYLVDYVRVYALP